MVEGKNGIYTIYRHVQDINFVRKGKRKIEN